MTVAVTKGSLSRISEGNIVSTFTFQFNPTEMNRNRAVEYTFDSPPGSVVPIARFSHIPGEDLTLTLLLDATTSYSAEQEGCAAQMAELESLTQPDIDRYLASAGQSVSPPRAYLTVGIEPFDVAVTGVNFRITRWNKLGFVTRCYAEIPFKTLYVGRAAFKNRLYNLQRLRSLVEVQAYDFT